MALVWANVKGRRAPVGKCIGGVGVGPGVMLVVVGCAAVGQQRVPLSSSCLRDVVCRGF